MSDSTDNIIRKISNPLIITAASDAFEGSLLALLGSLNLNWPTHPPVLVYDLGLNRDLLGVLKRNRIEVRKVPPFCPHWRYHYTWKLWCLNDAPAENILWLDAGLVVLRAIDEIPKTIEKLGYFVTTNYELLDWEASEEACFGCGVSAEFRAGKMTLPGTLMGFKKSGIVSQILTEALSVALVEKNIAATNVAHRHDQAILSLLLYKYLDHILIADGAVYLGSLSPRQVPGQKIWVHRRSILTSDVNHFADHISKSGKPHLPSMPFSLRRARSLSHLYRVYWCFGRGELREAGDQLEAAFAADPALKKEVNLLARKLSVYQQRLIGNFGGNAASVDFTDWVLKQIGALHGAQFVGTLQNVMTSRSGAGIKVAPVDNLKGWRA